MCKKSIIEIQHTHKFVVWVSDTIPTDKQELYNIIKQILISAILPDLRQNVDIK